jgi:hypothetical protein
VSEAIERDFQTMVWLAHAAGQLLPATRALRLDDTLKQFAAPLHEQVRAAAAAVMLHGKLCAADLAYSVQSYSNSCHILSLAC